MGTLPKGKKAKQFNEEEFQEVLDKKDINRDMNFFEVFQKLFNKKVEEFVQDEIKLRADADKNKKAMFEFTKRKIVEMEKRILLDHKNEKAIKGVRVTKLDNEAAVKTDADLQKELL